MTHILLVKAEQNRIIAKYAESQQYYANAVSRKYYSIFLRITHYLTEIIPYPLECKDLRKADPCETDERFKGSHGRLIREISKNAEINLGDGCDESFILIQTITEMRSLRNRAEYWPVRTEQRDLDDVQRKSDKIEKILIRLQTELEPD